MAIFLRGLLVCFTLGHGGTVLAEPEVHVIAVNNGQHPDDFYALPEVRVLVDRPGQDISLVLLDGGQVHWQVETTSGTLINDIVRSGPDSDDSKVTLSGIPLVGVDTPGLPLVFHPLGRNFRTLVDSLTVRFGTERIHSFQRAYKAEVDAVKVDRVDRATAGLARDYLSHRVGVSEDLPGEIRDWVDNGGGDDIYAVAFDESGVSLTGPTGTQHFPATADVPDILLPSAAVFDPGSQSIYAIAYGGEGYLYSVDVETGGWAVVASLNEYDPAGLLYEPRTRQLITTGAFSRPGDIRVFGLEGSRSSVFVPTAAFPGLTDLFDYGNEHGPPLRPQVFSDGWLLLEALGTSRSSYPDTGPYRIYALRIATGEVRLLRYHDD